MLQQIIANHQIDTTIQQKKTVLSRLKFTSRIPLITEIPSTLSRPRSNRLATTMTRSKIFHPLPKYSLLNAANFKIASRRKKVVKTCNRLL